MNRHFTKADILMAKSSEGAQHLLVLREMKIKTTTRCHNALTRIN